MDWSDLPVKTQENQKLIEYDPKLHGKQLSEAFSRGERVKIGKDGASQVVFMPIGSTGPDSGKRESRT